MTTGDPVRTHTRHTTPDSGFVTSVVTRGGKRHGKVIASDGARWVWYVSTVRAEPLRRSAPGSVSGSTSTELEVSAAGLGMACVCPGEKSWLTIVFS